MTTRNAMTTTLIPQRPTATPAYAPSPTSTSAMDTPRFATAYASVGNRPMPICRPLPSRLVGVWAHPDDEAYLSAGLMARVIDAGGSVTVITVTDGEHGTGDPELAGTSRFARSRRDELTASLAELGVDDVRFLGLPDGGCVGADDGDVVSTIAETIAALRPDAIVTFGPDGITGHPDHRAVSQWTTAAWSRVVEPSELLYATMTKEFLATNADLHNRLGVFDEYGGSPASVSSWSVALGCSLTDAELARKRRALAYHASQTEPLAEAVGEVTYTSWWRHETFRTPTRAETATGDRATAGPR
jgi:LmbE family N-acetylglucosaminyl deacetylase